MKLTVGYQPRTDDFFVETIVKNRASVAEVYFSWGDYPNGRGAAQAISFSEQELTDKKLRELQYISGFGISLNLLLNGNCYGRYAQSRSFYHKLGDTLEYLRKVLSVSLVTTTSPLIAKFMKENFTEIQVRASVNMGIGTIDGMDYMSDLFDSFYLQREMNRCAEQIEKARDWCHARGKTLFGLANSGCLSYCSAHTFHDNLVSHEREIAEMDNAYAFEGQCVTYLSDCAKRKEWLHLTNFIRPEDVRLYEGLYDGLKLATRVSNNPAAIVEAYVKGSYKGSVHALLEPNHGEAFYPSVIENKALPSEFGKMVMHCQKKCEDCDYCRLALEKATVNLV